jgi:CTP-dependent riboflavin kinase
MPPSVRTLVPAHISQPATSTRHLRAPPSSALGIDVATDIELGANVGVRGDLSGIVQPGRGLAAARTADPAILQLLQDLAGFPIVPGTLNLRLPEAPSRGTHWQYVAATELGPDWETRTGQAGYFLTRVTIAERYRGLAFQADESAEPGYPSDLIELFSEVHLRTALDLSDGDHLVVMRCEP